ncbi:MAG: preprotein translocase subunit SecG [Rickettsiales bacterium]|jgi:protein translocase SecG subunit|nr:preprotein translocase subunit SecG [Rickettsiales bacterium]
MSPFLLSLFVFQMIVCVLLIVVVLLQSSDEDALSNISSGSGKFGLAVKRSSIDSATKFTIALGTFLIANSIALAILSSHRYVKKGSIIENYLKQIKSESK